MQNPSTNVFNELKDGFWFKLFGHLSDRDKIALSVCSKKLKRIYLGHKSCLEKGNNRKNRVIPLELDHEKIIKAFDVLFFEESPRGSESISVELDPVDKSLRSKENRISITLSIASSLIKGAGMGIIAEEDIPEGYLHEYQGEWIRKKNDTCAVSSYRWTVFKYDKETGDPISDCNVIGIVDGFNKEQSNWTRYVNCSKSEEDANLYQKQEYDKVYYVTRRPIKRGEELYVWYGISYAKTLGLL